MNRKGQIGLGAIIIAFITILVGAIFLQAIAQQVGTSTSTSTLTNRSLSVAVNGTAQYITDYRAITGVTVWNETGDVEVEATNYTITNNVINPTTGALSIRIVPDASDEYKNIWTISGTVEPLTYIGDSGARAVASLIIIMFALAVLVVALEPTLRSNILEVMGK